MKKQIYVFFFSLISSCFANDTDWIDDQIQEDLASLAAHSITTKDLYSWFEVICAQQKVGALYCQIRKSTISWKKTTISDEWRNSRIVHYLNALNSRYSLPDTDFILITGDAQETSAEMPVFAFAKPVSAKNVVLFPDFEMLWEVEDPRKSFLTISEKWANEHPWGEKQSCAFFRGTSTGTYDPHQPDFGNDRARVVFFSYAHPDLVDATFSTVYQPELLGFLNSIHKPLLYASIVDHYQYKYLLDIDGNSCAYSRSRWILLSNSTLVKIVSQNRQWYYKALKPWVHVVPVQQNLSDFADNLHFLMNHDDAAYNIAQQGRELGKVIFSPKMVDLYVVRLLNAYSRYVSVNHDLVKIKKRKPLKKHGV